MIVSLTTSPESTIPVPEAKYCVVASLDISLEHSTLIWRISKSTFVPLPYNDKLVIMAGPRGLLVWSGTLELIPSGCLWDSSLIGLDRGLHLLVPRQAMSQLFMASIESYWSKGLLDLSLCLAWYFILCLRGTLSWYRTCIPIFFIKLN